MNRDIVVIGGSAGGLDALLELLPELPPELPAAIFVVLHTSPSGVGTLPAVLQRSCAMEVVGAEDGASIRPGTVTVARPDFHLLLARERIQLSRGPRENRVRPAIDPLFRSAARSFDSRVVGIILSGALDDGVAGLSRIVNAGGVALVQTPASSVVSSMPESALSAVNASFTGDPRALGAELVRQVLTVYEREPSRLAPADPATEDDPRRSRNGMPSVYSCPECSGTLWELDENQQLHFRCRTGHGFSAYALLDAQREALEGALWAGLRALEENAGLADRMASRADSASQNHARRRFEERAQDLREQARMLREMLERGGTVTPSQLATATITEPEETD